MKFRSKPLLYLSVVQDIFLHGLISPHDVSLLVGPIDESLQIVIEQVPHDLGTQIADLA